MRIRRLPVTEAWIRRFVEDLWLPYHRELEATVDGHELADDVDLVETEVAFRLDHLKTAGRRAWIAIESGGTVDADDPTNGTLGGFVTAEVSEPPPVFDRPARVHVGDIYVREPHRGTGLAADLVDRVAAWTRERECRELTLDVAVDNDRALAFYERLGFEPIRHRLCVDVSDLG